jgi:hypothetical protein
MLVVKFKPALAGCRCRYLAFQRFELRCFLKRQACKDAPVLCVEAVYIRRHEQCPPEGTDGGRKAAAVVKARAIGAAASARRRPGAG